MYPPNTRILIVDDMLTMRKLVAKALREMGFTDVVDATDGAKAWEAFSGDERGFQLVISDWMMPNATGLDLLKRIRADGRFAKTPFLLVTAENEVAQVKAALAAGVTGYIVKPFTTESLRVQIEKAYQGAA